MDFLTSLQEYSERRRNAAIARTISLIWQEDFTTNVFSRSKFIKGQIVYQRSAGDGAYFARPYKIEDGAVHVPPGPEHERAAPSVLPGDALKLGCIA